MYKNCLKLLKIADLQPPDWIQRKKTPCIFPRVLWRVRWLPQKWPGEVRAPGPRTTSALTGTTPPTRSPSAPGTGPPWPAARPWPSPAPSPRRPRAPEWSLSPWHDSTLLSVPYCIQCFMTRLDYDVLWRFNILRFTLTFSRQNKHS